MDLPTITAPAMVDQIEVVDVRVIGAHVAGGCMRQAASTPGARLDPAESAAVLSLWRRLPQLPQSESRRCHTPPFGLRFRAGGRVVGEASICWRCYNVYWNTADAPPLLLAFDAAAPAARDLLAACERATGVRADGELDPGTGGG